MVISEGIVLDYDENGQITGIDIDNASHKMDLDEIISNNIPAQLQTISASTFLQRKGLLIEIKGHSALCPYSFKQERGCLAVLFSNSAHTLSGKAGHIFLWAYWYSLEALHLTLAMRKRAFLLA